MDAVADLLALAIQARGAQGARVPAARAHREPAPAAPHHGRRARRAAGLSRSVRRSCAAACPTTSWCSRPGTIRDRPRACMPWRAPQADDPDFWEPIQYSASRSGPGSSTATRTSCTTPTRSSAAAGTQARWFSASAPARRARAAAARHRRLRVALLRVARGGSLHAKTTSTSPRRVADHLALALSHQHLAEAARDGAAAARLEAQVATLTPRARGARRRAPRRRPQQAVEGRAGAGHARGADRDDGAAHRRVGHRQGSGRALPPPRARAATTARSRAINCAALPDQLLESELFGHERGAFTGAVATKPGRIEQAPAACCSSTKWARWRPTVQAKLLRVLEEREFMRLGSTRVMRADIRRDRGDQPRPARRRSSAASSARTSTTGWACSRSTCRRCASASTTSSSSPRRSSPRSARRVGRPAAGISRDAKEQLLAYGWPGNVRELRNAIERAVILADGGHIRSEHLPVTSQRPPPARPVVGHAGRPAR